jgi:hypothetical protein
MAAVHTVLGILVLALAIGGAGLLVRPADERLSSLAGLALGALALQVMTGFFLVTGTGRDVGAAHQFLPALALGTGVAARLVTGPARARVIGAASLFIVAVSVTAMVSVFGR